MPRKTATSDRRTTAMPALGSDIICPPSLEDMAEILLLMELQFFVQMALSADADKVLGIHGYGRAHHRALYFVARQPGIAPKDLVAVLGISNQALAKVMGTLIADGLIVQESDPDDRRVKRCQVTKAGLELLRRVFSAQGKRVRRAVAATSRLDLQGHIRLYMAMVEGQATLVTGNG